MKWQALCRKHGGPRYLINGYVSHRRVWNERRTIQEFGFEYEK
jgi:hypothetical protein